MEKPEGNKSLERKRLTAEEKQKIIQLRNQGYSLNKIAITLQRPQRTIANVLKKYKENQQLQATLNLAREENKKEKKERIAKLENELIEKQKLIDKLEDENQKLKEKNQEMKKSLNKLFDMVKDLYIEVFKSLK